MTQARDMARNTALNLMTATRNQAQWQAIIIRRSQSEMKTVEGESQPEAVSLTVRMTANDQRLPFAGREDPVGERRRAVRFHKRSKTWAYVKVGRGILQSIGTQSESCQDWSQLS
jgi:hypothetical protein